MAVKIKLKRMGKIRAPFYRIIVADARTKRDGRAIEEIGKYHPKVDPSFIEVNSDRAQYWLSVGAQPTDPVRRLLEITGDWQKFKGLPGAEGTLKTAAPKPDKKEAFAAAVAETVKDLKPKSKTAEPKATGVRRPTPRPATPRPTRARTRAGHVGGGSGGKAGGAQDEADRPRSGAKQASAGKARRPIAAAKDTPAKETAAKDTPAKEAVAKDTAAKDSSGQRHAPRTPPPRRAAPRTRQPRAEPGRPRTRAKGASGKDAAAAKDAATRLLRRATRLLRQATRLLRRATLPLPMARQTAQPSQRP